MNCIKEIGKWKDCCFISNDIKTASASAKHSCFLNLVISVYVDVLELNGLKCCKIPLANLNDVTKTL